MIALTRLRELDLTAPSAPSRQTFLSAASGLVCLGSTMYVIADDELHLCIFSTIGTAPGRLLRLFEGVLPDAAAQRKRLKPDFEVLALLPVFAGFPHGALLAMGSGSRPNRRRGALLALKREGAVWGSPRAADLSPILVRLADEFAEVNIEGALVAGNELRLFQRGNKQHPDNAVARFPLGPVLDALATGSTAPIAPLAVRRLDLGSVDGVPLCFTDAAVLPDGGAVFSAIAEDTGDAFNDGACIGAAVGLLDRDGRLQFVRRLDHPHKIEGIHASPDGRRLDLLLVTDADDADVPAVLYSAKVET